MEGLETDEGCEGYGGGYLDWEEEFGCRRVGEEEAEEFGGEGVVLVGLMELEGGLRTIWWRLIWQSNDDGKGFWLLAWCLGVSGLAD